MYDRIITIGSIYTEIEKLKEVLEEWRPTKNDKFIFFGNFVQGAKALETVKFLIDFKNSFNCIFIRGKFEELFLKYYTEYLILGDSESTNANFLEWKEKYGNTIMESYKESIAFVHSKKFILFPQHLMFLRDTLSSVSIGEFVFHSEEDIKKIVPVNIDYRVFYSGNVIQSIYYNEQVVNTNTGCGQVEGGLLSSIDVLSMKIIQK